MTKVVYIAGPITAVPDYKRTFNKAANDLLVAGYIPLKPSCLPEGMTSAQYRRICFAMIDNADAVLFLPDWQYSAGAAVEHAYCEYIGKHIYYNAEEVLKQ